MSAENPIFIEVVQTQLKPLFFEKVQLTKNDPTNH